MANQEHVDILMQGVETWNQWRREQPSIQLELNGANLSGANLIRADLSGANMGEANMSYAHLYGADLRGADLSGTDLSYANLRGGNLSGTDLSYANLSKADLSGTDDIRINKPENRLVHFLYQTHPSEFLPNIDQIDQVMAFSKNPLLIKPRLINEANLYGGTDLSYANLEEANLRGTNLRGANLYGTNINKADLSEADLSLTRLVKTNLKEANLTNCRVYGIAAWDVQLEQTIQNSLIITPHDEPQITVDNLKIAQFIYLLLNNQEIRDVIDTITSKVVLILGRFTPERKAVLDAIRDELRKWNYLPVMFDFERPASRDFTETVRALAHLSRFIIADLTDPSSIPQELQAIVPDLEVPVQPLLLEAKREYSMFVDFRKYHWVLPVHLYKDRESLVASLQDDIIEPAEKKARELVIEKARSFERS